LSLLVLLVAADDPHDAVAAHDLALDANPLDRCPDLHGALDGSWKPTYAPTFLLIRPRPVSRGLTSTRTRSPTTSRTKFRLSPDDACAVTSRPSTATR